MSNEIPRRNQLQKNSIAELAIRNAVDEIERMPASEKLTKAIVLLTEARELVADFIDEN